MSLALLPYMLFAGALIGMLAIYFTLKREIAVQAQRHRRVESMLLRMKESGQAAARESRPEHQPEPEPVVVVAAAAAAGATLRPAMNLNKRVQALRLMRRGEDHSHVASALGVPRCEVDLLVRVHKLAMATVGKPVEAPGSSSAC